MGEYLDQIPEAVQEHIRRITATSGLPEGEESVEQIAQAWLEKKRLFEQRIEENNMMEVDEFSTDEDRGALLLTYSGSLLTLGPLNEGKRTAEYTSIGLRQDVPDSASAEATSLTADIACDSVAEFSDGPVQKSSAVFIIAVAQEDLSLESEEELLSNVTQVVADDFVGVNKTIISG